MKKELILKIIFTLFTTISAFTNNSINSFDDNLLIEKILKYNFSNYFFVKNQSGFIIVSPKTFIGDIYVDSPNWGKNVIWPKVQGKDITYLIDNLIEKNTQSKYLSVHSSIENGYLFDYHDEYTTEYELGYSIKKYIVNNRKLYSLIDISLPYYDPINNLLIVYIQEFEKTFSARGYLIVYQIINNELEELQFIGLWVS
jgi:hypothetical protein